MAGSALCISCAGSLRPAVFIGSNGTRNLKGSQVRMNRKTVPVWGPLYPLPHPFLSSYQEEEHVLPRSISRWRETIAMAFPRLSRPQATVLALRSYGMVLGQIVWHTLVCATLALQLGCWEASLVQRLREWYYAAKDKRGAKRQELEVSMCFAPLLRWLLSWWSADEPRLALALDASTLVACRTLQSDWSLTASDDQLLCPWTFAYRWYAHSRGGPALGSLCS